jgi:hypothetical protein
MAYSNRATAIIENMINILIVPFYGLAVDLGITFGMSVLQSITISLGR